MNGETDHIPAPRENPHFQGHDEAERTLLEAFASGRLPHAWLISGPRGVGKATLAFRFARYVLAQGGEAAAGGLFGDALPPPETLHLDADSAVFRRVASGGHADLLTAERRIGDNGKKRRSEIVVEDVRAIGAFLRLTPAEGGWRVVVVDSADEMNRHSANALLKVLEEPSPKALLLVVSHNPGRLLATIRSRCRRLTLKSLGDDQVAELLGRYRPDLEAGDARDLARLGEGSIGRALALANGGGLDLYRDLMALVGGLPALDVQALHTLGDRLGRPGAEDAFRTATQIVQWWLGHLILVGARADPPVDKEEKERMERLVAGRGLDPWLEVWEKITRLLARAESANLSPKQVVLNVFFALENAARP
ncbi:MAG: DNA polymerase III subunit delta' [Rhodospirillales bacterium]|jgi:DNA polymerase-3 subunit delta'|nr:DNA polymerase III subunit delta' [Rhodospirillales bacterium]